MTETTLRLSGLLLIAGAILLSAAIVQLSFRPMPNGALAPAASLMLFLSALLLLPALPAVYAMQARSAGWPGAAGYVLLQAGVLLLVLVSATPILYPAFSQPPPEHPVAFLLGIAMVLGLLLTGIATMNAGVFPRWAGILLLVATAGFFFDFFVAEFLPPIAGRFGSALFGIVLGVALAWIGVVALSSRPLPA
jgi:hypothetical protein